MSRTAASTRSTGTSRAVAVEDDAGSQARPLVVVVAVVAAVVEPEILGEVVVLLLLKVDVCACPLAAAVLLRVALQYTM
jgi:hypothetical protein